MSYPDRLFKYLPSEYLSDAISNGNLLFRNFTYFKQQEDRARGDYLEACHRDNPDNDISITNLSDGIRRDFDASFLNSTDTDLIFMFCTSQEYSEAFYEEFGCDACIEITDPQEFSRRILRVVVQKISTHRTGLLCRPISYYRPNHPTDERVADATVLPFLKDQIYSDQKEFRFVFGTRRAFKLKQQIILNQRYDFKAEAMKGAPLSRIVSIGPINDISIVHRAP